MKDNYKYFSGNLPYRGVYEHNLDIDVVDLAILDFMRSFAISGNCVKTTVGEDGRKYYYISCQLIIDNLQILHINTKRGIQIRIKKLIDNGLLVRDYYGKEQNNNGEPMYCFTELCEDLGWHNTMGAKSYSEGCENSFGGYAKSDSEDNIYKTLDNITYKEKEKEKEFDILNSYPSEFRQLMSRFPRTTQLDYEQCYPLWSQLNVNDKRLSKYIMGVYAERINQGCLESIENAESFFNDKEWLKQEWELYYDGHITTDAYGNVRVWDGWEDSDRPSGTESNNGEYVWESGLMQWIR